MRIWVVEGATGEYSYAYYWPVAAYTNEQAAYAHADAAQEVADRIFKAVNMHRVYAKDGLDNPYDPEMAMDYAGTHYGVWSTELREAFVPVAE